MITKEVISFAFVKDEMEIDHIPLSEVEFVREMVDIGERRSSITKIQNMNAECTEKGSAHTLQISTIKDGHNSGRAYYIQIESKEKMDTLLTFLQASSKAARKRLEAQNAFRKTQYRVRKLYESNYSQAFIALLITLVNAPARPPPPTHPHFHPSTLPPPRNSGVGHRLHCWTIMIARRTSESFAP